jgi:oxysterol-binding protein-related protein 9/10/11
VCFRPPALACISKLHDRLTTPSHHPPTTACYVTSSSHGIHAHAHSTQSTTLNFPSGIPTVLIKQSGHALLHIDAYNEDHLLPLPDVRVKGILSGSLYPELAGTYRIVSSSGFTSEVCFSGKGWMSGSKNSFDASIFHTKDEFNARQPAPVYTARGQWSVRFDLCDGKTGNVIETCDPQTAPVAPLSIPEIHDQDTWRVPSRMGASHLCLETKRFHNRCHGERQN